MAARLRVVVVVTFRMVEEDHNNPDEAGAVVLHAEDRDTRLVCWDTSRGSGCTKEKKKYRERKSSLDANVAKNERVLVLL